MESLLLNRAHRATWLFRTGTHNFWRPRCLALTLGWMFRNIHHGTRHNKRLPTYGTFYPVLHYDRLSTGCLELLLEAHSGLGRMLIIMYSQVYMIRYLGVVNNATCEPE